MRLTTFTDYGLRALMRLATDPQRAFSTAELADEFQVSRNHLAKVIAALSAAGFIETRRGGGGGAVLARPADQITIGDAVRLLERGQSLVECFQADGGGCVLTPRCHLKGMLAAAEEAFLAELDRRKLSDCVLDPIVGDGGFPTANRAANAPGDG